MKFFVIIKNGLSALKRWVTFLRNLIRIIDWLEETFDYAIKTFPYDDKGNPRVKVDSNTTEDVTTEITIIK